MNVKVIASLNAEVMQAVYLVTICYGTSLMLMIFYGLRCIQNVQGSMKV